MTGQWVKFEYGLNIRKQCYILVRFPGFHNADEFLQENALILLTVVEFEGMQEFIVLFLQLFCRAEVIFKIKS